MTRKLVHSLAILGLMFLAGQGQVLMAQSAPAATGLINAPFGARPGFPGLLGFKTGARQKTGSHIGCVRIGVDHAEGLPVQNGGFSRCDLVPTL